MPKRKKNSHVHEELLKEVEELEEEHEAEEEEFLHKQGEEVEE